MALDLYVKWRSFCLQVHGNLMPINYKIASKLYTFCFGTEYTHTQLGLRLYTMRESYTLL